jgi:NADH-quinone oxidoreductase subunit J
MEKLTFYFFALILIFAASRVITVKNPVHAALFLVLAFVSSAAIWLLLQAEFLALALILVYVGAVMVLFLFVVMMLDINFTTLREGLVRYFPIAALVGVIILVEMIMVVSVWQNPPDTTPSTTTVATTVEQSNTQILGKALYTDYVYPFEIAAVILLVAMVAAIALTMRPRRQKYQQPEHQVSVRRDERVRLVKMPAESKE